MKITINGVSYGVAGNSNVVITNNGSVMVNGKTMEPNAEAKTIEIKIEGHVRDIEARVGNVTVNGEVSGSVSAGNSVECGDVGDKVSAGGSVECDTVGGNVSAGGSVECGDVTGKVSAGGSVRYGKK